LIAGASARHGQDEIDAFVLNSPITPESCVEQFRHLSLIATCDWHLPDAARTAALEDGEGGLWIGTRRGGLVRLKSGKFSAITTKDGLPDDCVYQILDDKRATYG
jgi:ligand-binding sensor domain-containing protein